MKFREVPECCRICHHFDSDYNEFSDETYYFCVLNIFFPTKKGNCKRQKVSRSSDKSPVQTKPGE